MIVALDATALILLLDREAAGPKAESGQRVRDVQARLAYLATRISKSKGGRLVIPTPAFGEAIVKVEPSAASQYLALVERLRGIRIADFNKVAAIEFAIMQRQLLGEMPRRLRKLEAETRAKAKFDQQIVAIAKVELADFIVTDDQGLARYAKHFGLRALGVGDLDLPPVDAQGSLPLDPPAESENEPLNADDGVELS